MSKQRLTVLLAVILLFSCLTGCGGESVFGGDEQETLEVPGFPITMLDRSMKEVTLEHAWERVVCTDSATLYSVASLGRLSSVVAYTGPVEGSLMDTLSGGSTFSSTIPEDADVVLYSAEQADLYGALPNAYCLFSEVTEFVLYFSTFTNLSNALMASSEWHILETASIAILNKVNQAVGHVPFADQKTFLFLNEKDLCLALAGESRNILNEMGDHAACINAAASDTGSEEIYVSVTAEHAEEWDPDVIWVPWYADYTVEDVVSDPVYANLRAVKEGSVRRFPGPLEPWYESTFAAYIGTCWMAYDLYPELYPAESFVEDVNEFYEIMYHMTFTPEELCVR